MCASGGSERSASAISWAGGAPEIRISANRSLPSADWSLHCRFSERRRSASAPSIEEIVPPGGRCRPEYQPTGRPSGDEIRSSQPWGRRLLRSPGVLSTGHPRHHLAEAQDHQADPAARPAKLVLERRGRIGLRDAELRPGGRFQTRGKFWRGAGRGGIPGAGRPRAGVRRPRADVKRPRAARRSADLARPLRAVPPALPGPAERIRVPGAASGRFALLQLGEFVLPGPLSGAAGRDHSAVDFLDSSNL